MTAAGTRDLEGLLRRLVDVLVAIAESKDPYERWDLIGDYSGLLLEVPDEEPTLSESAQDALEDVNTDLNMYDRHGNEECQYFYNDDETVLRYVVKALAAIAREALDRPWA
jgi:hypothetical protein